MRYIYNHFNLMKHPELVKTGWGGYSGELLSECRRCKIKHKRYRISQANGQSFVYDFYMLAFYSSPGN